MTYKLLTGRLVVLAAFLCLISGLVRSEEDVVRGSLEKAAEAGFSEMERRIIKEYLGQTDNKEPGKSEQVKGKKKNKQGLPPGLARKDELPPGLARQLKKNGTLPLGLAKRDLPDNLKDRLPAPPEGYERSIVEDATVVLVEKATGRIADIITDIIINNKK